MKKRYLIMAAIASLALVSCSDEEFVGEQNPGISGQGKTAEIVFGSVGKGMTRADLTGEAAADELNKNFVFEGTKAVDNTTYSLVINDYQANYKTSTAHSTESNSDNWVYVGYKNVPGGVTTNVGVPTFAESQTGNNAITQSIKYWDYGTSQYDFAAYSLGKGVEGDNSTTTYAKASAINFENLGKPVMTTGDNPTMNDPVYSLTGSAEELKACYISDLVTAYNQNSVSDYGNVVTFSFRSLAAKIRIAFYETVPGYSVKDINFYSVAKDNNNQVSGEPTNIPTLFTSSAVLPSGSGTMNIFFPTVGWNESGNTSGSTKNTDYNKAHVKFAQADNVAAASKLTFDAISNYATSAEGTIAAGTSLYIGRASNDASYAGGLDGNTGKYYTILPNEAGANLMLRIKYTLVSSDNSGETITVDNATAVIPAELAQWQPNYAYTYIFKISDMTNGTTGVDQKTGKPVMGLTPITLNAVVVDSEDGIQETITTVSTPSITTYTQGKVVTENDEYLTNANIYIIVNNGTQNVELTTANAKLYKVTTSNSIQNITEESVDNALRYGDITTTTNSNDTYTVTDITTGTLTVQDVTPADDTQDPATGTDWLVKKILADDSPTGNEIVLSTSQNQAAKFAPTATGTYVFQYQTKAESDYTADEIIAYNAALPGAITAGTGYSFTSYAADKNTVYGTGKAKQISQENGWTTVLVTENDIPGFAGKQYKVHATTIDANNANTYYQLYETDGTATGIYVKVSSSDYSEDDAKNYNAALQGAINSNSKKPAEYQYKIIKVVQ